MSSRSALHFQLSLMQLLKLVAFCAAAFAFVAPIMRVWKLPGEDGISLIIFGVVGARRVQLYVPDSGHGISLIIFSAVGVPLIWVALSVVLVRRAPWRDRLILSLLLCSVSVALAAAAWMLYLVIIEMIRNGPGVDPPEITYWNEMIRDLSLVSAVTIVLAGAACFLGARLVRKLRSDAGQRSHPSRADTEHVMA